MIHAFLNRLDFSTTVRTPLSFLFDRNSSSLPTIQDLSKRKEGYLQIEYKSLLQIHSTIWYSQDDACMAPISFNLPRQKNSSVLVIKMRYDLVINRLYRK